MQGNRKIEASSPDSSAFLGNYALLDRMPQAKQGDKVAIHYKGQLDDGTVFDSSAGREPLEFQIGANQVIPGFEAAVKGLDVGQKRTTRIEPEQAYGPRRDEMVITVGKERFPEDMDIELGQEFQLGGGGGDMPVVVTDVTENMVTLDGNHPLAGKALTFHIELVSIG